MNKKVMVIGLIILVLAVILGYFLMPKTNAEYKSVLYGIEKGNSYMISNNSGDACFPYRYFHRGCYYGGKLKFYEGTLISSFSDTNLTQKEKVDLCYKFAFKGSTAWCLNENNENGKCLEFAKENEYLVRICNLKEGQLIPSEDWGPYPPDNETVGGSVFDVDSWEPIKPMSYSDLI